MAVTLEEISANLRLTTSGLPPEPILSILTRLAGVADAFVELMIPGAPDAIKDEVRIRQISYLFEQPGGSAGDRFGNSWRNSGAGSLASRWIEKNASIDPDSDGTGIIAPGGDVDQGAVQDIVDARPGYIGAFSALSGTAKGAIKIGDVVLHQGRFWVAHILSLARVTAPGGVGSAQSDGWHPLPPQYRGVAAVVERHYDQLEITTVGGAHFVCLTEGKYNASEVIAGPNWAALGSGSGVALSTVETLINLERASTIVQVQGFLANYSLTTLIPAIVAAGVETWARIGATNFVPADHLPDPTQSAKGAPYAAVNDDIDESPGSRQSTLLAYTVDHLKRLVHRIVPTWARAGNTTVQIPVDILQNAPAATGSGLNTAAVKALIATDVKDFAEVSDTTSVIPQGLYQSITVAADLPTPNAAIGSQFYGTGGSHADRVYWPKRIVDQKTITFRADHLTEARGDAAIVGWQLNPELGLVRPPWGAALGVTRLAIEPSGGGASWRISMSGGSGLAHPVGLILTGVGTQTITLFRRSGSGNDGPIYDSVDSTAARQLVAGATYSLKFRYSGGQNFFNIHDSDYLEGLASSEDTYDLKAEIDKLQSQVASLAAAPVPSTLGTLTPIATVTGSLSLAAAGAAAFVAAWNASTYVRFMIQISIGSRRWQLPLWRTGDLSTTSDNRFEYTTSHSGSDQVVDGNFQVDTRGATATAVFSGGAFGSVGSANLTIYGIS